MTSKTLLNIMNVNLTCQKTKKWIECTVNFRVVIMKSKTIIIADIGMKIENR